MIYKDIKLSRKQFYVYLEYPFVTTDLSAYRITTAEKNAASIAVTAKRADGSTLSCIDTAKNGCVLPQDVYAVEGELKLFISISDENGSIVTENQVIAYVKKGFDSQQSAGNQNTSSLAVTAYNMANGAIAAAEVAAEVAETAAVSVAKKAEKDHTHTDYDTATLQAMYNEVIEPSPEEWFTFDSETQAITGLNEEYAEEYSATDVSKLIVPYSIDGVIVKRIEGRAFIMSEDMGDFTSSIPANISDIRLPNCIEFIGYESFVRSSIKSINIPTSCYNIEFFAFGYCFDLHEVISPIKPNWELTIGESAFANCSELTNIDTIIDGVKRIPHGAFRWTGVENVTIPESIDVIEDDAFSSTPLQCITFFNKNCYISDNMIEDSSLELIKGYKGSTAETYAKNNSIPFMSIEGTEVLDKADSTTVYTTTETDDMLSAKADKADLDWELIGESNEITEADVVSAGDKGITSITIDLGKPIDSWYRETRIDIYSPKSTLNSAHSGISINMGVTEEYSHVFNDADLALGNVSFLVSSQSLNFAPLFYNYNTRTSVITTWDSTGKALYSTIIVTGANANAYPYTTYGTALFYENHNAIGKQFVTLLTRKNDFKFPAGAKITMYGRGKV